MSNQLPALVIVIPLLGAVIAAGAGWLNRKLAFPVGVSSLFISFLLSVDLLVQIVSDGKIINYKMAGWAAPIGIVYTIDHLSALMFVVITSVALLNLIFNGDNIEKEFEGKEAAFIALYVLFTTGMIGMVATGDAFNLYVLLEIVSLSGYALLGIGSRRAPLATLNYLFIGTIGATFYLLGVGYLYMATGTLNMADIASMMPGLMDSSVVLFAFIICMSGLLIKMAIFPVHGWLPRAYSETTSTVAGLIAPLTTKVTVYVVIRICLSIFTLDYVFDHLHSGNIMLWLGMVTMIFGALSALAQKSYKRIFAYIIISEVGYMLAGFFLGNSQGMTGAMLHIVNDAAMTLVIFMAAAIFLKKTKGDHLSDLQGLFTKMPLTMAGFTVGALSIIGVPPTCGFFSKWYLISGGLQAGNYYFVASLIFCSLINVVIFFRIFEIALFEPFVAHHATLKSDRPDETVSVIDEAPLSMLLPFLLAASSLLVLGLYSGEIVTHILSFVVPTGTLKQVPSAEVVNSLFSIRPLLAVFASLAAVPLIVFSRSQNSRETWTFIAGVIKFGVVLSMLSIVLDGGVIEYTLWQLSPGLEIGFRVDALGMLFALVASALWIITSIYSIGYMRSLDEHSQTRYFAFFAVAMSATIGVAFSANLLTLYLFYETLSLATYPLVTHHQDEKSRSSGRKYLFYILGSSIGFALPAMMITYHLTGTLDFVAGGVMAGHVNAGMGLALTLMFLYGFAKVGLMPLHSWLPAAMVAPTPVSALLHAVAVVKVGAFSVVRVFLYIIGAGFLTDFNLNFMVSVIASITIIVSSLIALSQDELKRRLAFSTIGQLAYIVLGMSLLTPSGITGGIMHIGMHAFGKITLFFCAGAIFCATGIKNVSEMKGIGRRMPVTMFAFLIGSLSVIGLPPCGGFISKWYLVLGTIEAGSIGLLIVLLTSSFLNAAYLFPLFYNAFFCPKEEMCFPDKVEEAPLWCVVPLVITATISISLFFYPRPFLSLAQQVVKHIIGN